MINDVVLSVNVLYESYIFIKAIYLLRQLSVMPIMLNFIFGLSIRSLSLSKWDCREEFFSFKY